MTVAKAPVQPDALLIDTAEAAKRLSLSPSTVQSLMYSGELPSIRIGRSRRIDVADLESYVKRLRMEQGR